jgi:phosphonate transport system substrate-binding protein
MDQKTDRNQPRITRRQMLRGLGGTEAAACILAACGGPGTGQQAPTAAPAAAGSSGDLTLGSAEAGSFSGAPDFQGELGLMQINIAFIPAEDAAKTLSDNKDLLAYLKQVFGVEVNGAVGTSYSAVIEAQRAKKVDLAFYGPFTYILGNVEANAQALIQGETKDGQLATYTSLIITQADSPLASLADIKGKNFSFVDPASTSGHLVPSYTLLQRAGLHETDYKPIYAGSHPASYEAVVNKKVDAGAIASDTFAKGIKEGSIDEKKVKILDTSFPIPGSPIAVRGDIPAADQDLLVQAFMALNDQGPDSKLLRIALSGLGAGAIKLRKADDHAYDELRKIPAAIGIDIKGLVK